MVSLDITSPVSPSNGVSVSSPKPALHAKSPTHKDVTRELLSRGYLSPLKLPKLPVSPKSPKSPQKDMLSHLSQSFSSPWFSPAKASLASTQSTGFSDFSSMATTATGRKFPSPSPVKPPGSPRRSPRVRGVSADPPSGSQRRPDGAAPESKGEKRKSLVRAMIDVFGSSEAVLTAVEASCTILREGVVSTGDFLKFLGTQGIRWESLTGYRSSSSLFRLVSAESGVVDVYVLLELGRPVGAVRVSTEGLIDRYLRGIQRPFSSHETPLWTPKDLDAQIELSEEFAHCMDEAESKRKWIKFMFRQGASKLEILAPHLHGITGSENDEEEIEKVIRGDIDAIRQDVRSIEAGIRDFAAFRKEVERCRGELNGVSIEQQRRDEEEKRRRNVEEQRREMARGLNNSVSLIGHKMHDTSSTMFRMPTEAELVNYFNEEECVDAEERKFRKLIKSLGISILEAEEIRKKFEQLDKNRNGRLDKEEFSVLIAEMLGFVTSNVQVPQSEVDKYWRGIPKDMADETINFENFLVWFRSAQAQRII